MLEVHCTCTSVRFLNQSLLNLRIANSTAKLNSLFSMFVMYSASTQFDNSRLSNVDFSNLILCTNYFDHYGPIVDPDYFFRGSKFLQFSLSIFEVAFTSFFSEVISYRYNRLDPYEVHSFLEETTLQLVYSVFY